MKKMEIIRAIRVMEHMEIIGKIESYALIARVIDCKKGGWKKGDDMWAEE